jgi:hypothetical protein
MAPASWSTAIAHPRIVCIAGLPSLVISMEIAPERRIVLSVIGSGS